jgi:hypothetical protein
MAHNYIAPMPLTVTDKTNADRDWRGDPEFGVSVDLKCLHIEKKRIVAAWAFIKHLSGQFTANNKAIYGLSTLT